MKNLVFVLITAAAIGLVGCKPNLIVSLSGNPYLTAGGSIASITTKISNTGNATATGTDNDPGATKSYMVDFVLSTDKSVPMGWATVPSPYVFKEDMLLLGGRMSHTPTLARGASVTKPGEGTLPDSLLPADTIYLVAIVDPGNKVVESNENDNVYYMPVVITH